MEANGGSDMSELDKPRPRPRTRENTNGPLMKNAYSTNTVDVENTISGSKMHSKREAQWANQKEELLERIEELQGSLKEKETQLKEQDTEHKRAAEELESENEMLQKRCEELQAETEKTGEESKSAIEAVKDLLEKSQQTNAESHECIQELEREVDRLSKSLCENDQIAHSHSEAMEEIKTYENKQMEAEQTILSLKVELARISQENKNTKQQMHEVHNKNVELQEERDRFEGMAIKEKKNYEELSAISDDMEKEMRGLHAKIRQLTTRLQEQSREFKQKSETVQHYQQAHQEVERKFQSMVKSARDIQTEKDNLESELVALKLERKGLTERDTNNSREMDEMRRKTQELTKERDVMAKKMKDEDEAKQNEIKQLSKELKALNEENNVMRQRVEKLEAEVSKLSSIRNELETQIKQLRQSSGGKENGGFRPDVSRKRAELMDTSTEKPGTSTFSSTPTDSQSQQSCQWYESDEGGRLFAALHTELKKKFDKVEITRRKATKAISLIIWVNSLQNLKVHFPATFPQTAVTVEINGSWKEVIVPYNRNKRMQVFCEEFCQMLVGLN